MGTPKKALPKSLWKSIERLERRIEDTVRESPAPGYIENMFAHFDREDLTLELIGLYEQLHELEPNDVHYRYRFAGALMRASNFDSAREVYTGLKAQQSTALLMLAMLELKCGNRVAAEEFLDQYNRRCVTEGMPFMQTTLEKIALPPAANSRGRTE